jgi:ribonuclease HI
MQTCYQAIVRLWAHLKNHPLHQLIRTAAKHFVSSHHSTLHKLTHFFSISPDDIETLIPDRWSPITHLPFKTHIAESREEAIKESEATTEEIQIYCDGSGYKGNTGAAAILFWAGKHPCTLRYHLGTDRQHTVYEAEEVGLILTAHLLATEEDLLFPASISIDNQAAILSSENLIICPGTYLADTFRRSMHQLAHKYPSLDITIRWIPGHEGLHGNEEVDKEAKQAAESINNSSPNEKLPTVLQQENLPLSISALLQEHQQATLLHWSCTWNNSPRFSCINQLDPNILHCSFIKLTASFPKHLTSLLINLWSQHIPLNKHLHWLGKLLSLTALTACKPRKLCTTS